MQATLTRPAKHDAKDVPHQYDRVERQYSSSRPLKELVRDLLRAHSGE